MQCKWCGGNGKHRGQSHEKELCEICLGFGETANPPGSTLRHVLTDSQVDAFCSQFSPRPKEANASHEAFRGWLQSFVRDVAKAGASKPLPLSIEEKLVDYWLMPTRDENLGEFVQRIAQCAIDSE